MDVVPVNLKNRNDQHNYNANKNRLACRIKVKQTIDVQFYNDANIDLVTTVIKELEKYAS